MKETKKDLNEIIDKNLQSISGGKGGTFDKVVPNVRKISAGPKDIFPKNSIAEILNNIKKDN